MTRRDRGSITWREDRKAYYVRWFDRAGARRQARGGKTVKAAQAVLNAILEDEDRAASGAPLARAFAEFLADEHLPSLAERLAPKVYSTRRDRLLLVARMLRGRTMEGISRADAEHTFVRLARRRYKVPAKKGRRAPRRRRSPLTLAQFKTALSVAWDDAIARGFARENPWRGIKLRRAQEFAVPYLSEEDLTRLYAKMPDRLRPIVTILGETAIRRGEALALAWRDVASDLSSITIARSKSGRVRAVPLTGVAKDTLRALLGGRQRVPRTRTRVFADVGVSWPMETRRAWRAAVRAARLGTLRVHDLRHARASLLVRASVPIPTVASWLGHSTPVLVLSRYGHHAPADHLQRALQTLETARAASPDLAPSGGSATTDRSASPGCVPHAPTA
jgi:integrase